MSADITQAPDTGMVERVARAICLASTIEDFGGEASTWASVTDANWHRFTPEAVAAIVAMREPTVDMVNRGVVFALDASISDAYRWPTYVADKHRAMIDAALGKTS